MDGVADGYEILFRCAAVGHNMKVEPRRIPLLAVLKIVGIYLCLGQEGGKYGRTKQYDSGVKPHRCLIFGKNSVFCAESSSLSAKNSWFLYI